MSDKQLAEVGTKMSVKFPPDTQVIGVKESHDIDDAVFMKAEIAVSAWPHFLEASPFKEEDFAVDKRYLLEPDQDWWNPSAPRQVPTAQTYLPGAKVLNMGVDRSDDRKVVIYLFWHAT